MPYDDCPSHWQECLLATCENASWGNVCTLLDWNALSSKLSCLQLLKSDLAMIFCLVSLGVTDNSWEIVGMDFVTELTTSLEFHLTTILDLYLPYDMAHFLLCHKKSPLTKLWLSLLIIVLDFMVFHKSLCLIDTLPCWQNSAIFDEEIEYQTHYECGKTSSTR